VASSAKNTGTIAPPSRAGKAAPHARGQACKLICKLYRNGTKLKAKWALKIGPDSDNGFHLNDR
jgi:hypothetical protein